MPFCINWILGLVMLTSPVGTTVSNSKSSNELTTVPLILFKIISSPAFDIKHSVGFETSAIFN
jgi:hypothetical protein